MRTIYIIFALLACTTNAFSQEIHPVFYLLDSENPEEQHTDYSGSAPIRVRFEVQTEGFENPNNVYIEWKMYSEGSRDPFDVKRGNTFDYTFSTSGQHRIVCTATYEEVDYDGTPLIITVQESKLEFPNAFSPNGDGINDTYRAKPGCQSIVEFKAAIFNRWGQMVFQFRNIYDEWDGTYKGRPVKDGVYFLNCEAKGADGRTYHIRRDINILRNYIEEGGGEQ